MQTVLNLFLADDVMTGRGIDQILKYPSKPILYKNYVKDARQHVSLTENKKGAIPRSVKGSYILHFHLLR